jgi:hypothetical protein
VQPILSGLGVLAVILTVILMAGVFYLRRVRAYAKGNYLFGSSFEDIQRELLLFGLGLLVGALLIALGYLVP